MCVCVRASERVCACVLCVCVCTRQTDTYYERITARVCNVESESITARVCNVERAMRDRGRECAQRQGGGGRGRGRKWEEDEPPLPQFCKLGRLAFIFCRGRTFLEPGRGQALSHVRAWASARACMAWAHLRTAHVPRRDCCAPLCPQMATRAHARMQVHMYICTHAHMHANICS